MSVTFGIRRALAGTLVLVSFIVTLAAFGGRSLAWAVAGSAALAALAALLLEGPGASRRPMRRSLVVPSVAALGLALVAAFGLIPLPASLASRLAPRRVELDAALPRAADGRVSFERWLAASHGKAVAVGDVVLDAATTPAEARGEAGARPAGFISASFDPPATRFALVVLCCWLALLLALAAQEEALGGRLLAVACVVTAGFAIHAIWWAHRGNGKVYGVFERPPNIGQIPFGPFWNPNHFAALLAMATLLALGLAVSRARPWLRATSAVLAVPLAAGVVDAGSRGGLIALGAGLVLMGVLLLRAPGRRWIGATLVAATAVGLVLAFVVFPERIVEMRRREVIGARGSSNFSRARIYRAQIAAARQGPLVGIGLGALRTAYPSFQTRPEPFSPLHGERDWIETLAEGGVPLLLLWLLLVASLALPALRAVARSDPPLVLVGLVASLAAVLVHAAVDFHLREPSVAVVAVLVAATAHAVGVRLESERGASGGAAAAPGRDVPRLAVLVLALGGLAGCVLSLRAVPWDVAMRRAETAFARGEIARAREAARTATAADPARASSWALLAACEEQLAFASKPVARGEHREAALDAAVRALRETPAALGAARIAGAVLLAAGAVDEALEAARLAVLVAPGQAPAHRLLGQILLRKGLRDEALPHLAFAFDALPGEQLDDQALVLARMVREAARAEPAAVFAAMRERDARILYLSRLVRDGHDAEVPAYLRIVREEGVRPDEAEDWTYGLMGSSPEAADLARELRPHVASPIGRVRIARALASSGDAEGWRLLDDVVAGPDATAFVHATKVEMLAVAGRLDEARAAVDAGLAAFPGDPGLDDWKRSLER